jgi:hypothetical protein
MPQQVVDRFTPNMPPKTRIFVLKKLWQQRKRDLAGIAFGAIGSSTAAFSTLSGSVASAAGFAALSVGAAGIFYNIKTFVNNYQQQPIARVKDTIKHHIERALDDPSQTEEF